MLSFSIHLQYLDRQRTKAMRNWLKSSCKKGFGEELAADLLASFYDHCTKTNDMKRPCGRVVFGQLLREFGFDHRKLGGLARWSGLKLKQPPKTKIPTHYQKTERKLKRERKARAAATELKNQDAEAEKKKNFAKFQERVPQETARRSRAVGENGD